MHEPKEVVLCGGEKVMMEIEFVTRPDQILVRATPKIIIGVARVNNVHNGKVFFWQEMDGIYQYIGDAVIFGQEDGGVSLSIYGGDEGVDKKNANWVIKQSEVAKNAGFIVSPMCVVLH